MQQFDYGNLSNEFREFRTNEVLSQKRRQQLRINNHELQQLERHLQLAIVNKQLKEQKENTAQLKKDQLRKKREENAKFSADCDQIRLSIIQQEEQEKQNKKSLLDSLKSQINEMQQKRRKEFEDVNKERDDMEKLMKQIQTEDILKRKDYKLLCERRKKEMEDTFCNIRLKEQLEKIRADDENKQNLEYQNACDKIKFQRELERKRLQKEKNDLSELLAQQIASINLEKNKREDLLISLLIEERKSKEDQDFKEALIKNIKERKEFRTDIEKYRLEIKIQKEKQFKEEEEKFRKENMHYLEEQDKLWQLSEQKRRSKILDHKKLSIEMIEQRRYQKANKIAEEITAVKERTINNEERLLLIEQERLNMLSSVPRDLLSYLPPGVLKTSDVEFLKILETE